MIQTLLRSAAKPATEIRTFVGVSVQPTDPLRDLIDQLDSLGPTVRATPANQLHITLKFIGNMTTDVVPAVAEKVQLASSQLDVQKVNVTGCNGFPYRKTAEVLWACPDMSDRLTQAAHTITSGLSELGINVDDYPFTPHITVAHLSPSLPEQAEATRETITHLMNVAKDKNFGETPISPVRLYRSHAKPGSRPRYTVLHEAS